jgi:hypothetical protein
MKDDALRDLVARHLAGELGPEETDALLSELERDPAARETYLRERDIDGDLRRLLAPSADPQAFLKGVLQAGLRPGGDDRAFADRVIRSFKKPRSRRLLRAVPTRRAWLPALAAAAAALLAIVAYEELGRREPVGPGTAVRVARQEPRPASRPEERAEPLPEPRPAPPPREAERHEKPDVALAQPEPSIETPSSPPAAIVPETPAAPVREPEAPRTPLTEVIVARLVRVSGNAVLTGDGPASPIQEGQGIPVGRGLRTVGRESRAALALADGTRLELGGETLVQRLSETPAKRVELAQGTLRAEVSRQPVGRPMTLATPHAEATVLGTRLTLAVDRESCRLDVTEGSVRFTREPGRSLVVGPGEYAVASVLADFRVMKTGVSLGGLSSRLVPASGCLWGVSLASQPTDAAAVQAMADFEASIGRKAAIVYQYRSFAEAAGTREFPSAVEKAWARGGRILMLSWKPKAGSALLKWADVAAGRHDAEYVDPAARKLAAWGQRMFLALHPMPDDDIGPPGSGMTAADFVAMWRHVRARFDAAGATNVVWVWTVLNEADDASRWEALYPGDAQVDWLACQAFNTPSVHWRSLTGRSRGFLDWVDRSFTGSRAKPVMLATVACAENPAPSPTKEDWFRGLPAEMASRPRVKGIVTWSQPSKTASYIISSSPAALAGYRAAGLDPFFNPD